MMMCHVVTTKNNNLKIRDCFFRLGTSEAIVECETTPGPIVTQV